MKKSSPRLVLFIKSHVSEYTRKDGTFVAAHDDNRRANPAPLHKDKAHVVQHLSREEAKDKLWKIWSGGRSEGQHVAEIDPTEGDDGSGYVEAHIPLHKVRANDAGEGYDATTDVARAKDYAKKKVDAPVHLLFSERAQKRWGQTTAAVHDGGHRVAAARIRGDTHVRAIMQRSHFERLMNQ